jgi:hypothetical protein
MDNVADVETSHFVHSTLRERIVEHVFVGEALRLLWQRRITDVEVLRSEFDAGGYDLVMSCNKIVRHIQFKTTSVGGKAANIKANLKLMEKPSGCIIWIFVTRELELAHYRWFGGAPRQPLPDILKMKIAKHAKGNSKGDKTERLQHRIVPKSEFDPPCSLGDIITHLFGPLP